MSWINIELLTFTLFSLLLLLLKPQQKAMENSTGENTHGHL